MTKEIRLHQQRKLASMVFSYSLANSIIAVFLPAYYLKFGSTGSLDWVVEFLSTQFLILGFIPRLNLRIFAKYFEKTIMMGLCLYSLYDGILIFYPNNPFLVGIAAGFALATFWPSFNVLQLKLTNQTNRATTINTISILVTTIGTSIGPVLGGLIISSGAGFPIALIISSALYLASFFSIRTFRFERMKKLECPFTGLKFAPLLGQVRNGVASNRTLLLPISSSMGRKSEFGWSDVKNKKLFRFYYLGFMIQGLTEVSWFVYPIYVFSLTRSYVGLGIVASVSSIGVAVFSVILGRISDSRRKSRFGFIALGVVLNSTWLGILPAVSNGVELILASTLFGVAGAMTSNIFASIGDHFSREEYCSVFASIESSLMIGRLGNLALMFFFIVALARDFFGYFETCALIFSVTILVYYLLERQIRSRQASENIVTMSIKKPT